ncbi:MAG: hypothetical protein AAFP90_10145 [Planctomycetota bacterium]
MNRDPNNQECTRDPIFLLQVGHDVWNCTPDGLGCDGDAHWVEDKSELPCWVEEFVVDGVIESDREFTDAARHKTNVDEIPYVRTDWKTEAVFLTREEAESFGEARAYRWPHWKVFCVPCEGDLARVLDRYELSTVLQATDRNETPNVKDAHGTLR